MSDGTLNLIAPTFEESPTYLATYESSDRAKQICRDALVMDTLFSAVYPLQWKNDDQFEAIVIDFAGVNFVDSQGAAELGKIADLTTSAHVSLRLARVKADVLDVLQLDGTIDKIGADRFYDDVFEAVQAELGA